MRPIRLEMQAFGPYLQRQTLDFRDLKNQQVFLVHGPTGAGKTTLFDAMAYALYGRASGDRPASEIRSKQAPAELPTEVVFDFAIGADLYRVRRRVKFREITRGPNKGTLEAEPAAELLRLAPEGEGFRETEAIAHLDTKVTAAVTERIGLGAEQFLQVIVLPQGKFRQFLASKSNEREEILKALFRTDPHKRLQESLDRDARALSEKLARLKSELRGKAGFAEGELVDPAVFEKQLKESEGELQAREEAAMPVREELARLEAELSLERQLLKRFEDLDAATRALQALELERPRVEAQEQALQAARRAKEVAPAEAEKAGQEALLLKQKELLPTWVAKLEAARVSLLSAQTGFETAEKEAAQSPKHQARLETLTLVSGKLLERERLRAALRSEQEELERLEAARGTLQERVDKAEAELLPQARERLSGLKSLTESAVLLVQARQASEALKSEVDALELQQKSAAELSGRIELGARKIAEQERVVTQARERYEQLDEALAGDQAAQLAHRLKDGEPCPVCGSSEHPRKAARVSGEAVDREKVKKAQAEWHGSQEELNRYRNKWTELQAKHQGLLDELERAEQLLKSRGYRGAAELERQIADARAKAAQAERAALELPRALLQLSELESFVTGARGELKTQEQRQGELARRTAEARGQLKRLDEDLKDESARSVFLLEEERARLEKEITRLARNLEGTRKGRDAAAQSEAALKATTDAKRAEIADSEKRLELLIAAFERASAEQGFESAHAYFAAKRDTGALASMERGISAYRLERARVTGSRDDALRDTQGRNRPELQGKEARKLELSARHDELNREIGDLRGKQDSLAKLLSEVFDRLKAIAELEREYAEISELALVANGRGGNRYNMSFQRYVQSIYFEEVLQAASYRLEKMSQGRYHLKRSEELGKGNVSGGLDLVVEDRWFGTERPASTLSGGEGFMASLSLALALSQIVQEENGAIRMDAIFIDEGFGTLDEEALRRAIDTLMELHEQGRMVGIISHVPELRQVIPARIEITPRHSGSEVRIVPSNLTAV